MTRGLVRVCLIGAALLFTTAQARADVKQGPYVGVFGDYVFQRHAEVNRDGGPNGKGHFENGWSVGASVGYKFDYAWRPEIEVSYRRSDVDDMKLAGVGNDGDIRTLAIMGNVYYDMLISRFIPYIGVGAGAARVKADYDTLGTGKDWVFAYQFMAGLSYALMPNLRLRLGYKFFGTRHAKFSNYETGNTSHNVELGVLATF